MTRKLAKILLSFIVFYSFFCTTIYFDQPPVKAPLTLSAHAREFVPATIPKASNLPGPTDLAGNAKSGRQVFGETVLPKIAVYIIGFTGGLSLLFLVIGGARFAMSYANEEDIGNAKNQVIYALAGLLVSLLSYAVVAIIVNLKFEGDQTPTAADNAADESERAPANP